MATIDYTAQPQTLVKGDSDEWLVSVSEEDPLSTTTPKARLTINLDNAVDGTVSRKAIVRAAAKRKGTDSDNIDALFFKDSQLGDSDINFLNQGSFEGDCEILIDTADTTDSDEPVIDRGADALHDYDVEINRQDAERAGVSQVGTITVVNGSNTIIGVDTKFLSSKKEDILNVIDVNNLLFPTLIETIVSDTEITVGRTLWVDGGTLTFEVRRNRRRTGAAGDLFFLRERVSKT